MQRDATATEPNARRQGNSGRQKQWEATAGNQDRAESEETGNQLEAKPAGGNGRKRETTATEPESRRPEPILKTEGEDP